MEIINLEKRFQLIKDTVSNDIYNVGEKFFEVVVQKLNVVLEADYSFVGKLLENGKQIQTISLVNKKGVINNFTYDLQDTPCENVVGRYPCSYPKKVAELFPKDELLVDMGIEAYTGVPLYNSKKEPTGIIVSLYKREVPEIHDIESILMIFAARASAELEHMNLYARLEKNKQDLEKKVLERTKELRLNNKALKLTNKELSNTLEHLRATQSKLVQSEKMASLGFMTAGVAHEINNPLGYLSGAYFGLSKYFEEHGSNEKDKTEFLTNAINVGIERISAIVKSLNQFGRSNDNMNEKCDIHDIIENCLIMINHKIKHKITIKKNYSNKQVIINGNTGKIHQIFLNILTNSIQAISKKGEILIHTIIQNNKASIVIEDNGSGIHENDLKNITDPFFTTKSPGNGTGLGLSITYSIIKQHNGTIDFKSELLKGTRVTITLPLKQK
jgi:two-component system NtrC family sensor kinase